MKSRGIDGARAYKLKDIVINGFKSAFETWNRRALERARAIASRPVWKSYAKPHWTHVDGRTNSTDPAVQARIVT